MRNEMQHPEAERLEAFVEGTLDAGDRVVIASHLQACPDCQTALEEWKALFAALEGLPQFEPAPGFAERVMAGVKIAPAPKRAAGWNWHSAQTAVMAWAGSAAGSVSHYLPKTTFGWAMANAFLSLPFVLGAAAVGWLVSKSYITPESLWAFATEQAATGLRGLGEAAVATALQTDVALWLLGQSGQFLQTAGFTGVGVLLAAAGAATALSTWVIYRNLFRTPARDTTYASFSF
jgi:anti-sigma factor RsiW